MVLASALCGFFQAIGKAYIPLWIMLIAIAFKAILNPILIDIPFINISGAPIATIFSYLIVSVIELILLKKYSPETHVSVNFLKIIFSSFGCSLVAGWLNYILTDLLMQSFATILSVMGGAFVYVLLLILTSLFRTSPIIKSQKIKKRQKRLEKSSEIG